MYGPQHSLSYEFGPQTKKSGHPWSIAITLTFVGPLFLNLVFVGPISHIYVPFSFQALGTLLSLPYG